MNEFFVKSCQAYLRYHDLPGEHTPILFIHGLGCAGSFDYPQVAEHTALRGHRRILVDLLGAGYSDKPVDFPYSVASHTAYLKDLVDALNLERFIIFGHSLGGAVAIELAAVCGSRVTHLILSEANLDPSGECAASYEIAAFSEDVFLTAGFEELLCKSRACGNTMWAATLSHWLPAAAYRFSKSAVAGGSPSWRTLLYRLPVSKSYIFGALSLPDDEEERLRQQGIYIEVVPCAGHSMAWENPQGLALAIVNCLQA